MARAVKAGSNSLITASTCFMASARRFGLFPVVLDLAADVGVQPDQEGDGGVLGRNVRRCGACST